MTTSTARATNVATGFDLVGLGLIRNNDLDIVTGLPGSAYTSFGGVAVGPYDLLVKHTYIGDANLDGLVSFDDYVGMDNAFFNLIPNLGWATGDINFDNLINFDDYTVVDQAFFFQGNSLAGGSAQWKSNEVDNEMAPGSALPAADALADGRLATMRKSNSHELWDAAILALADEQPIGAARKRRPCYN